MHSFTHSLIHSFIHSFTSRALSTARATLFRGRVTLPLASRHLDERVDSGARDSSRRAAKTNRHEKMRGARERGEDDRVYWRLAGDENESFSDATSVIIHVDVKIEYITLVAYARRHYNATSVIITISTSTHIITLVALR